MTMDIVEQVTINLIEGESIYFECLPDEWELRSGAYYLSINCSNPKQNWRIPHKNIEKVYWGKKETTKAKL